MIFVITSTKGGVGKSNSAVLLACLLEVKQKNFKIVEIDNNNQSLLFKNSEFLNEEIMISVKLDKKTEVLADVMFNTMNDPSLDYIIDLGGGDDTKILESIISLPLDKKYIIPITADKKYLKNAVDTFEMINDPENTFFILNRYSTLQNLRQDFIYFFGDEKMGIQPVSPIFTNSKYVAIPNSQFFQIAADEEQTILDLAKISMENDEREIHNIFFQQANGDRQKYHQLFMMYEKSKEAAKVFAEIIENTKPLNLGNCTETELKCTENEQS